MLASSLRLQFQARTVRAMRAFLLVPMKKIFESITREHVGLAFMVVGFVSLVAGFAAHYSSAIAAIVAGVLLLVAGVAIDRMS